MLTQSNYPPNCLLIQAEADSLLERGAIQLYQLELQTAIASFEAALDLYSQLEMSKRQALILGVLGKIYSDLEKYDRAIANYQQALHIYRRLEDAQGEAAMLYNLSNAYTYLERYNWS